MRKRSESPVDVLAPGTAVRIRGEREPVGQVLGAVRFLKLGQTHRTVVRYPESSYVSVPTADLEVV